MIHKDRKHEIVAIKTIEDMAEELVGGVSTLETGFRCGKLTLLNDSTSPDAVQEYEVRNEHGKRIDSISVYGNTSADEVLAVLRGLEKFAGQKTVALELGDYEKRTQELRLDAIGSTDGLGPLSVQFYATALAALDTAQRNFALAKMFFARGD